MTGQHLSLIEHRSASIETRPVGSQSVANIPESGVVNRASKPHCRNGKIARLPKLERDMVNRLLRNNIPHSKIVEALGHHEIYVTQRNISNWRTRGGYKEWCAEQEQQLRLSLLQDHLTDYLRKNDAGQLPEVGLQVASTQLSLMLLQPDAARQLAADPKKYAEVVDMLCRLSTQIQALQKDRNEAVERGSRRDTAERLKRKKEEEVEITRKLYSAERLGQSAYEEDIPHRNELPPRDELPFQEPPPKPPSFMEILKHMSQPKASVPALPAPKPQLAKAPAAGETPAHNGSAEPK
jgi:hypothetical protein